MYYYWEALPSKPPRKRNKNFTAPVTSKRKADWKSSLQYVQLVGQPLPPDVVERRPKPLGAMEEKLRGPEEYTHGGVKKTKFEPKVPARRSKKLPAATKCEPGEADGGNQALPRELQRLLEGDGQRNQTRRRAGEVAFGFSTGPRSQPAPSGAGRRRRGGGEDQNGATIGETQGFGQADAAEMGDARRGLEGFDHEKYYPVTLLLQKPGAGDPSRDWCEEQEEEGESGVEAARELGLRGESEDEDVVLFFQFPKRLPVRVDGEKIRAARLEELGKGGGMGKVLVYESGVVKFKVGDVVLDALPGTECAFAQEVAAVNVASKQCAFVGGVHKRVVLTPDFTTVLRETLNPKPLR